MHILKFGGTSMGDENTWRKVLDIISRYENPLVVVSATARTTRQLLAAAEKAMLNLEDAQTIAADIRKRHEGIITNFLEHYPDSQTATETACQEWIDKIIKELEAHLSKINQNQACPPATKDAIASLGERLSSYLFAQCGTVYGLHTSWIDASDIIRTDSDFGKASPDVNFINSQAPPLVNGKAEKIILVMGGYYGQDANGNTTTLGFEGSDYTASLIGAALSADAVEIWTDVSGIYTCDPRVVSEARPIPELSFQEATELAYFGAKVLHPSTTKPASQQQIPVWVKNIFAPDAPGTCISHTTATNGRVKAMTFKEQCVVITVTSANTVMGYEFLGGVFETLRNYHLPVDVVTTTEASVSIAIEYSNEVEEAVKKLKDYGSVALTSELGIISLVGCNHNETRSLVHDVLSKINSTVHLISYSQSKGNLNIVLNETDVIPSVLAIHHQLFN